MAQEYSWKLDKKQKISLKDYDPSYSAGLKKDNAADLFKSSNAELDQLQELCYAAASHSVLIILQGMDTSGKDGTIRHVMSNLNPQGCQVVSFKAPTSEELSHDFLWRVHKAAPAKGMLGIFNRSHYEDVLIVRVHSLATEEQWQRNYDHINHFEKLLADKNTIILKFFLHISSEEQAERLLAREQDETKRWKLSAGDYEERKYWEQYQQAFDDLLEKCSTEYAPWYIIPANKKWFRNLAVADALVKALRPYRDDWEKALRRRGEQNYQELLDARKQGRGIL